MRKGIIVGGGITGVTVAGNLPFPVVIIEKEERPGGLLKSYQINGFTFDSDAHFLHFHSPEMERKVLAKCGDILRRYEKRAGIYFGERLIPFPLQRNLCRLPPRISTRILSEILIERWGKKGKFKSLEEFLVSSYGKTLFNIFFRPYFEKLFGLDISLIPYREISRFFPEDKVMDILKGFQNPEVFAVGYNRVFYYPKEGGIETFFKCWKGSNLNILVGKRVVRIKWEEKTVVLNDGEEMIYDFLVSTVPLKEFLEMVFPKLSYTLKEKLYTNSILCINLGVEGKAETGYHWIYFPEESFSFFRVGFYTHISPSLAPKGHFSLYVELANTSFSNTLLERVIEDLEKVGIIKKHSQLKAIHTVEIKYAYPLFLGNRNELEELVSFMEAHDVYLGGRFGGWNYFSIEDCIKEGEEIAKRIRKKCRL